MMEEGYSIKTEIFEGPLDLLLTLIERRKLFIGDIALAKVADEYITYIEKMDSFSAKDVANFILVASTLVLIKSKSLLPTLSLTEEEEKSVEELEERLRLYKRIKDLSKNLDNMFGKNIIHQRTIHKNTKPIFSPDRYTNKDGMWNAVKDILSNLPKKEFVPEAVIKKIVSLEEMIDNLTKRMSSDIKASFREFSNIGREDRINVAVSFLAMLELVKQGIIKVTQEKNFEDINMETDKVCTPNYS